MIDESDDLAAARVCSTCGGGPHTHPSGLLCVCEDGTRTGEVMGLRRELIAAQARIAILEEADRAWEKVSLCQIVQERRELRERVTELTEALTEDRENILALLYPRCSFVVAELCDTVLDKSGGLLGRVRDRVLTEAKETA